jgi:hypothetical protein
MPFFSPANLESLARRALERAGASPAMAAATAAIQLSQFRMRSAQAKSRMCPEGNAHE